MAPTIFSVAFWPRTALLAASRVSALLTSDLLRQAFKTAYDCSRLVVDLAAKTVRWSLKSIICGGNGCWGKSSMRAASACRACTNRLSGHAKRFRLPTKSPDKLTPTSEEVFKTAADGGAPRSLKSDALLRWLRQRETVAAISGSFCHLRQNHLLEVRYGRMKNRS